MPLWKYLNRCPCSRMLCLLCICAVQLNFERDQYSNFWRTTTIISNVEIFGLLAYQRFQYTPFYSLTLPWFPFLIQNCICFYNIPCSPLLKPPFSTHLFFLSLMSYQLWNDERNCSNIKLYKWILCDCLLDRGLFAVYLELKNILVSQSPHRLVY